jgi:hypothetical protein
VIHHHYLRDEKFDTFHADIQQIKILNPGSSIACSGFKRRNAPKGRFDIVKPASSHAKNNELDGLRKDQSKREANSRTSMIYACTIKRSRTQNLRMSNEPMVDLFLSYKMQTHFMLIYTIGRIL